MDETTQYLRDIKRILVVTMWVLVAILILLVGGAIGLCVGYLYLLEQVQVVAAKMEVMLKALEPAVPKIEALVQSLQSVVERVEAAMEPIQSFLSRFGWKR
ncbi:MAG: hypothetical protein OYM47_18405 [Gemmatimonadota bacterium]|nr:hypothetical protein [Gemmatimonadota bacterium]